MNITIGTFTANCLITDQPFGYQGDAINGLTAREWTITGLLTRAQAATLIGVYDTWRTARITDADTFSSASVGTTVSLTINSGIASVTALPCWFTSAPKSQAVGVYESVSVTLVDAAQALAVELRTREKSRQATEAEIPSLGTQALGSCTLTLITPPDTYQDGPQLALTPAGNHRVTGPRLATRVRVLEGYTDATGWTNLRSWYETTVAASPAAASLFPIAPPTATAEVIVSGGVKTTRYTASVTVAEVI
jgi:hypothetical protein